MCIIKAVPEDFFVEEVPLLKREAEEAKVKWKEKMKRLGKENASVYTILKVKKVNMDTFSAISALSKELKIPKKSFGFAGMKDKRAVTVQFMSVPFREPKEVIGISAQGAEIIDAFLSARRIKLGDLEGNRFRIAVRGISREKEEKIRERIEKARKSGFPNLFGDQRFGSGRMINHIIGKHIIKGEFEQAVMLFLTEKGDASSSARERLSRERDFSKALSYFPRSLSHERAMILHLSRHPGDFAGALSTLPKTLGRMFVHAYQSWLWNMIASEAKKDIIIPIIGSKTDLSKYPDAKDAAERVMKREGITFSDFVIRDIMHLTTRGDERRSVAFPKDVKYAFNEDEMNEGKIKLTISFFLPKGSYATVFIKFITGAKALSEGA